MGTICFDSRNTRRNSELVVFTDKNDIYGNNDLNKNQQFFENPQQQNNQQPQMYSNYPQQNLYNQNSTNNVQNMYSNLYNVQFPPQNNQQVYSHNTHTILDKLNKMYSKNYY